MKRWSLLFMMSALIAGCAGVGQESWIISEADEIELGTQFHQELLTDIPEYTADPAVVDYIRAMGQRLVPVTDRPDLVYTFTVLDTDQVNAFAVLGGFVYVTRGLLQSATTGAEVATIMAHELGHISARHGVQSLETYVLAQGLADLLGGDDMSQIIAGALQTGDGLLFSKEQEFEADELGIRYALAAGFNGWAMVDFFGFLQTMEAPPADDDIGKIFNDLGELFSTHPPTGERISTIEGLLGAAGATRDGAGLAWEMDPVFGEIKGRL